MPKVLVKENEHFDAALRRFKRLVEKAGIPKELRKREAFIKRSVRRSRAAMAAIKRLRKKLEREKQMMEQHARDRRR